MHAANRILWFLVLLIFGATAPAASAQRPNIVLILADDVGSEVLGCYGGTSYETPQIDRLASEGTRFEQAYVMPVCHPTRTTLLTGQYPFRLGHPPWGSFPRDAEQRTLPALLQKAGYATAVAGKWQLALLSDDVDQPRRLGFDEYCLYGWHEGPWYYQPHIRQNGKLRDDVRNRYGPDVISEFVIEFMERNREQPFFVFYSMSLCHAETNDLDKPAPVGPNGRYDNFGEMVEKMDQRVGQLVDALVRLKLRDQTLVIYLSDNGTAAHNLVGAEGGDYIYEDIVSKRDGHDVPGGKATLTDRGTRVPLIATWPGTIEANNVSNTLTDISDILPSLADLAGAPLPPGVTLDGHSLTAIMRGHAPPRRWVFAEHDGECFLRNERWKLYNDGRFYDMKADPEEKRPLANDSLPNAVSPARTELQKALDGLSYKPPAKAD